MQRGNYSYQNYQGGLDFNDDYEEEKPYTLDKKLENIKQTLVQILEEQEDDILLS